MVKCQAWSDAVSLLLRFGEACDKGSAYSSQAKAYLGAIVVWLYAGNVQQAWQVRAGTEYAIGSRDAAASPALRLCQLEWRYFSSPSGQGILQKWACLLTQLSSCRVVHSDHATW